MAEDIQTDMAGTSFYCQGAELSGDIAGVIMAGFKELGVSPEEIRGKRILLKPNLVETDPGAMHINTHPAVVYGAAQAFLRLGAGQVIVAEGPGIAVIPCCCWKNPAWPKCFGTTGFRLLI